MDMVDNLSKQKLEKTEFSPLKNHDAISVIKQPDGNWGGTMVKDGKIVQIRQGDPLTVVGLLLTTDGTMPLKEESNPGEPPNVCTACES